MLKSFHRTSKLVKYLIFTVVLVLLATSSSFAQKRGRTIVTTSSNGNSINKIAFSTGQNSYSIKTNGTSFNIKYEGDIEVSADDKDITGISDGGFIEITKSSFGNKRRLLIESDHDGKLIKRYYLGNKERDYEPDGKEWLAQVLPRLVRTTTIGSKSRLERFYKKGGVDGVLSEIQQMGSDYVKSAYFEGLIERDLTDDELRKVIQKSGEVLKSDYYLAEILSNNQEQFLRNAAIINAYIAASGNISSDHYKTKILEEIINNPAVEDPQLSNLLEISKKIQSDYYLARVYLEVMDARELNELNTNKLINLSDRIRSDYYKAEVLKDVINKKDLSSEAYKSLIVTMDDIQSDHYLSEVLGELWQEKAEMSNDELTDLLSLVNNHLQSDYYQASFYKSLSRRKLAEDQLIMVLKNLNNIHSDYYLSEALQYFASQARNASEEVKAAYRSSLRSINSSTYYGRAAKAID